MQRLGLLRREKNGRAKLPGKSIDLCIILKGMSSRKGSCKIGPDNHRSMISPDHGVAIAQYLRNMLGKFRRTRSLVRSNGYLSAQAKGRVRQHYRNRLVNHTKGGGVRRMSVHDTVNIAAPTQNTGMQRRLDGGTPFALNHGSMLVHHHNIFSR